jgi:hypothetical protein
VALLSVIMNFRVPKIYEIILLAEKLLAWKKLPVLHGVNTSVSLLVG